ncbi:hypothetical protein E1B28_007548 [Marasmius oreades]|uniref:Uncharacterized protein n=1 Tax=Marasmius oreades TaxID=181124 RepID=A0A9P7S232_9AGAR|nr:uncharacterized protein E1B28_007548 [Marasmius oreades]KAG7093912.1 hypothetical protein E1B28_007548 [Marasmius oreades]
MNTTPKPLFSLKEITQQPEILVSFAKPGSPVKSFDGLCGNHIGEVLVTSPNMNVLYTPPLNECRVRMRKHRHFGYDDPLFFPQPFSRPAAHLAVIRVPQPHTTHPFSVAWMVPDESHFVASDDTFCAGFGVLQNHIRSKLVDLSKSVIDSLPENRMEDSYMRPGLEQLRRLLDRLELAAPKDEVFLRFSCTQRHILELDARGRWVSGFRDKFGAAARHRVDKMDLAGEKIMGAFTDDLDDLESLFQSNIPVWFVRRLTRAGEARIDKLGNFIYPFPDGTIRLHSDFVIDLSDATPSHRVVFTGLARNPERYIAMANYIASLFEYPSVLGTTQPRSSTSLQKAALPLTPGMPIRHPSQASKARSTPYPKGKGGRAKQPNTANNSFLTPSSPLMPSSIEAWKVSLEDMSGHNQSLPAPDGVSRGYALPPPDMFITTGNELTVIILFRNWLKLRKIFVYRLSSSGDRFSKKQWRQMLTLDEGKEIRADTRTGQQKLETQKLLQEIMGKCVFEIKNFASALVKWRNHALDGTKMPPKEVAREILWELYELNFRQDLVALDDQLDESGMSRTDRCAVVEACWIGMRDHADLAKANDGFGSLEPQRRMKVLKGLHRLMTTWQGAKPAVLLSRFPEDSDSHNLKTQLDRIERDLAYHYSRSFLEVFGRAASIPYRLPRARVFS